MSEITLAFYQTQTRPRTRFLFPTTDSPYFRIKKTKVPVKVSPKKGFFLMALVICALPRWRYDAQSGRRGDVIEQATRYPRHRTEPRSTAMCRAALCAWLPWAMFLWRSRACADGHPGLEPSLDCHVRRMPYDTIVTIPTTSDRLLIPGQFPSPKRFIPLSSIALVPPISFSFRNRPRPRPRFLFPIAGPPYSNIKDRFYL